ncbi:MAG: GNAT family N-acetyltransferase [Pseudomonadota bacterium]
MADISQYNPGLDTHSWVGPGAVGSRKGNAAPLQQRMTDRTRLSAAWLEHSALDDEILAAWQRFDNAAGADNIFYQSWFLLPSLEQFDRDGKVRLFTLWDGPVGNGELIGLMPMLLQRHYGRWPMRYISNWQHPNLFMANPNIRAGHEVAFWEILLAELDSSPDSGHFLHLYGIATDRMCHSVLRNQALLQKRHVAIVTDERRAIMETTRETEDYYTRTLRGKKRKELRRLKNRLSDMGEVTLVQGCDDIGIDRWIADFLKLESAGWKGGQGSALDDHANTREFFGDIVRAAHQRGQVELTTLQFERTPIAMLVSFVAGGQGYAFKTCFDESFARFSPGVLLQVENLDMLHRLKLDTLDSCAAEGHPMIDSLWGERRHVQRLSLSLHGWRGRMFLKAHDLAEQAMDAIRHRIAWRRG